MEARVRWWRSNPERLKSEGKVFEGNYNPITISPNDWALNGETITFFLEELQAEQTAIYNGRTFQIETLNLTFP